MGFYDAKTSQKGQLTIPAQVRKLIGLEPGGRVRFKASEDGSVRIVAKKRGIAHLRGIFAQPPEPIDIDKVIAAEVWRRNRPGGRA